VGAAASVAAAGLSPEGVLRARLPRCMVAVGNGAKLGGDAQLATVFGALFFCVARDVFDCGDGGGAEDEKKVTEEKNCAQKKR